MARLWGSVVVLGWFPTLWGMGLGLGGGLS